MNQSLTAALAFIGGFYVLLIGSKIVIAIFVSKSKSFLQGNRYIYVLRFLGFVLCILALILFYDGLKLMNIIGS